ncbi:YbaK/EbsC family protein [Peribacillus frigoritolerans]
MKMVKTLFLSNSKKTEFYLFITTADKPFTAKNFSNALGISCVSFAPVELMEQILGEKIGAATVCGVLMDKKILCRRSLIKMCFSKSGIVVAMARQPDI